MQGLPQLIVLANVRLQRAETAVQEARTHRAVAAGKTAQCSGWRQTKRFAAALLTLE